METSSSISSFKRFCFRVLLPYTVALVAFVMVSNPLFERYVIMNTTVNGAYKVNRILNEEDPNEIPIFGNSRAEAHLVSSLIHPHCFNYGLSGTHDDVLLFFLRQEVKKKRRTPILINFDLEGLDYAIGNPFNYLLNADDPDVRALLGKNYHWTYSVPMIKYYSNFDLFLGLWLNSRTNFSGRNDRGAVLRYEYVDPVNLQRSFERRSKTINNFWNEPALESAFYSLVVSHPERRFIVVVSPYHKGIFNKFPNVDESMAFLARAERLPNVDVMDFSHADYPDSIYNNSNHLSAEGAIRLSKELHDSLHARIGAPF
jgi:hypothetical protein